jgi:hypothetical protein
LNQLTTAEVMPPNQFEDQFPAIQKQVEQLDTGIFCFLSFDKKRIIIKANGYEQVQQAKYMTEVHLGMIQFMYFGLYHLNQSICNVWTIYLKQCLAILISMGFHITENFWKA